MQRYLTELGQSEPALSWYCYSTAAELPTKVVVRGLPVDTCTEALIAAFRERGFPATHARPIRPQRGRPGCIFFVQLEHLPSAELAKLYQIHEIMRMTGVVVEAWRPAKTLPQCRRCQGFGHSSQNCHRPLHCVRCAGHHIAEDCPRPADAPPTCANCAQPHAANDRQCPFLRKEARKRGIPISAPAPAKPPAQPADDEEENGEWSRMGRGGKVIPPRARPNRQLTTGPPTAQPTGAPTTLAPPANLGDGQGPINDQQANQKKKKKNKKKKKKLKANQPAAASTPYEAPPRPAAPIQEQQTQGPAPQGAQAPPPQTGRRPDQPVAQSAALPAAQEPAQRVEAQPRRRRRAATAATVPDTQPPIIGFTWPTWVRALLKLAPLVWSMIRPLVAAHLTPEDVAAVTKGLEDLRNIHC